MPLRILLFALMTLSAALAGWMPAHQPASPELLVTVRDATRQPLSGITIEVHDLGSGEALAATRTDTIGIASFAHLPTSAVRVRATGHLPSGVALTLLGADADGIAVYLADDTTGLDLEVEDDGLVRPDPATMLAPDAVGVPLTPVPSSIALAAPTGVLPSVPVAPILIAPTTLSERMPELSSTNPDEYETRVGWLRLLILLFLIGVLVLVQRIRRQS